MTIQGNRPEAEELYQDTFLKTLELLDKIQKTEIRKVIYYLLQFGFGKIGTGK